MTPRGRKFATTDEQGNFSDFFLAPLRRIFAEKDDIPVIPDVPTMQEIAASPEVTNAVGATVGNAFSVATLFRNTILDARGPSWVQYGPDGHPSFPELLPDVLGFLSVSNHGRSGRRDQDTAQLMVDTSANPLAWDPSSTDALLLHGGNNLIEPDTTSNRNAVRESWRVMAALAYASARIEQTGWTFRPNSSGQNWVTDSTQPYASGGTATIGFYDGLQVDIPVPAGTSYLLCHGTDINVARGATLRVSQNGVEVAVKSLDGQTVVTPYEANNGVAPVVIRLPNLEAGTVTVTVDHAGLTGQVLAIIDALLPQSELPRPVIAVKPVTLLAPTHDKPAFFAYYRSVIDEVNEEFDGRMVVVDPQPQWDPTTMLGPDGLHPTVAGTIEHRDAIVSTTRGYVWARASQRSFETSLTVPTMQEIADSPEIREAIEAELPDIPAVPSMAAIATAPEVRGAYAPAARQVLGARTVFIGDSITIGSVTTASDGTGNQNKGAAWPTFAEMASLGTLQTVFNAGVSGQQSGSMLARFDADVLAYHPDTVVIVAGTNDVGNGVTQTSWQSNMQAMVAKARNAGAGVVVGAIYPRTEFAATIATRNSWLYDWAASVGIPVIPFDQLADPATGGWPAAWTADGIHPTLANSPRAIGEFAWSFLAPLYGAAVLRRPMANGLDAAANGLFLTPGTSVVAPGTPTAATSTASGALPAGTYSYRATTRTYAGESLPSAAVSATLSSVGTITVTVPQSTGMRGHSLYRKGPADADWYLVSQNVSGSGASTFVDNGFATGAALVGTDTSALPAQVTIGLNKFFRAGVGAATDASVRGKFFRMPNFVDDSQAYVSFGPTNLAWNPGEVWEISALMRSNDVGNSILRLVWFATPGASATGSFVNIFDGRIGVNWRRVRARVKVPSNAGGAALRLLNEAGATPFTDIAEITLRRVS